MREQYFQSKITTGRFTLPVVILITTACWVISFSFIPDIPEREKGYSIFGLSTPEVLPIWANQVLSYLLHFAIGYFLIWLNNTFGLIRVRASIQTSVYLLLIAASPTIHLLYAGDIAAISMLLSIYFLFSSYQHPKPSGRIFMSFFLLGLGSLAFPQLTYFAPLWWIGAFSFKSLSPKSFMASILGWSFPFWFLFSYAYFFDDMSLFYQPFTELVTFHSISLSLLKPWEITTLIYCLIIFVVSTMHVFINGYKDKMRTQFYLYFLIIITFGIFIFILLQPTHFMDLLSLLLIGVSIIVGHMLALTNTKASNLFFVSAIAGLVILFCLNVWMLL